MYLYFLVLHNTNIGKNYCQIIKYFLLLLFCKSYSEFSEHQSLMPWKRNAPYPAWAGSHHQKGLASSAPVSDPLSRATLQIIGKWTFIMFALFYLMEAELLIWKMNMTIMVTTRRLLKDILEE